MPENGTSLGKQLANADKRIRDKTVRKVSSWLAAHRDASELDHLKLWKALFYCMWMSDKPKVQHDLAQQLAEMVHVLQPAQAMQFFKIFMMTMQREWPGLDKWRLDKFFMLIRKFFAEVFKYLETRAWKDTDAFVKIVYDPILSQPPNGLRYHVTDLYIVELKKMNALSTATIATLLRPFLRTLARTEDKSLCKRVIRDVVEPVAAQALGEQVEIPADPLTADSETKEDPGLHVFEELDLAALVATIWNLACGPMTLDKRRSRLYKLHRQLKELAAEKGIDIPEPQVETSSAPAKKKGKKGKKSKKAAVEAEEPEAAEAVEEPEAAEAVEAKLTPAERKRAKKLAKKAKRAQEKAEAEATPVVTPKKAKKSAKKSKKKAAPAEAANEDDEDMEPTTPVQTLKFSPALTRSARAKRNTQSKRKAVDLDEAESDAAVHTPSKSPKDPSPALTRSRARKRARQAAPAVTPQRASVPAMQSLVTPNRAPSPSSGSKSVSWNTTRSIRVFKKQKRLKTPVRKSAEAPTPTSGLLKKPKRVAQTEPRKTRKTRSSRSKAADFF